MVLNFRPLFMLGTQCIVQRLREAFPFDQVVQTMYQVGLDKETSPAGLNVVEC